MPTSRFHFSLSNILLSGMLVLLCMMMGACSMFEKSEFEPWPVDVPKPLHLDQFLDSDTVLYRLNSLPIQKKIDSLLILADLLKSYNDEKALVYAEAANQFASLTNKELSESISYYYLASLKGGQNLISAGLEEALTDGKIARKLFQKTERYDWQVRTHRLVGSLFYFSSSKEKRFLDSAKQSLDMAIHILEQESFDEKDSLVLHSEVLNVQLLIALRVDTSQVLSLYEQCLALYQMTGNTEELVVLQQNVGLYYESQKTYVKAEKLYRKGLAYAQETEANYLLPLIYLRLGNLLIKQFRQSNNEQEREKKFQEGLSYLYQAQTLQKDNKYLTEEAIGRAFHHRAWLLSDLSTYDLALIHYTACIKFAGEEGAYGAMQKNVNNIINLCDYLLKKNVNCEDILGFEPNEFLNQNYQKILVGLTKNLEEANTRIQYIERQEVEADFLQIRRNLWLISAGILLVVGLVFLLLLQQSQKRRLMTQMEALRAQINPHFISNSLNAIESLVNMGKNEDASKYLIHFSRLTRRILNSSRTPLVSLAEEIKTLEHFLALEQLRFRDKLRYDIELDPAINPELVEVPAMIIQPYLENAIWHGIKPKKGSGFLLITIEKIGNQLVYTVEDDGIGRKKSRELQEMRASVMKRKSLGMQITQERLRINNQQKGTQIEMIDLEDEQGIAAGTRVIVRLSYKLKKERK